MESFYKGVAVAVWATLVLIMCFSCTQSYTNPGGF